VLPSRYRPRVIGRQQTTAHEEAQQPPAYALLHRGDGGRTDPGGGSEDDPARRGRVEHAVDDHAMEVQMRIERGAEAVDEGDRAETSRGARTRAVRAQALFHLALEQM